MKLAIPMFFGKNLNGGNESRRNYLFRMIDHVTKINKERHLSLFPDPDSNLQPPGHDFQS